jgi:hypothetical protein
MIPNVSNTKAIAPRLYASRMLKKSSLWKPSGGRKDHLQRILATTITMWCDAIVAGEFSERLLGENVCTEEVQRMSAEEWFLNGKDRLTSFSVGLVSQEVPQGTNFRNAFEQNNQGAMCGIVKYFLEDKLLRRGHAAWAQGLLRLHARDSFLCTSFREGIPTISLRSSH